MMRPSPTVGAVLTAIAVVAVTAPSALATPGAITALATGLPAATDVYDLASGPNGSLWLAESGIAQFTRLDPSTGDTVRFATDARCRYADSIALMPDGRLWSGCAQGLIGTLTGDGAAGVLPNAGGYTKGLAAGNATFNWTVEGDAFAAVRPSGLDPLTLGIFGASGVTADAAGVPWVASTAARALYRLAVDDAGHSVTPTQVDLSAFGTGPFHVQAGPDGDIWSTRGPSARADAPLLRTRPDGTTAEVASAAGQTYDIARGPANTLWYTDYGTGDVGRIDPDGQVSQFSLPSNPGDGRRPQPTGIVMGSDGNMWVAALGAEGRVFRVLSGQVPVQNLPPVVSGAATAGGLLAATTGDWAYRPTAFAYRWQRCDNATGGGCTTIAGETRRTYPVVEADAGRWIRVLVTATNLNGDGGPDISAAVRVDGGVIPPPVPPPAPPAPDAGGGTGGAGASGDSDTGGGGAAGGASAGPATMGREAVSWIRATPTGVQARVRVTSAGLLGQAAHIGRVEACGVRRGIAKASVVVMTCPFTRRARAQIRRRATTRVGVSVTFTPRGWPTQSVHRTLVVRRPTAGK